MGNKMNKTTSEKDELLELELKNLYRSAGLLDG
jgi:hypothetical protein